MEHVSSADQKLEITSSLFDNKGFLQTTLSRQEVAPKGQRDLLVHEFPGWLNDNYGQVCSEYSGVNGKSTAPGSIDGRMIIYKAAPDQQGDYQFAFALPFSPGISGAQYVPFNTFQPSLRAEDQLNLAANWIQIVNLESEQQKGHIVFYNRNGDVMCQREISLKPKERVDTPAHSPNINETICTLGPNMYGVAAWNPDNLNAKFFVRNVRYIIAIAFRLLCGKLDES